MLLTKYHVIPASGGWRVVSTLGRTRFDGRVFTWTEACRVRERLTARQSEIYGEPMGQSQDEVLSDWPVGKIEGPTRVRRSTH